MNDEQDAPGKSIIASMNERKTALRNWERYEYVMGRGHDKYMERARRCEDFYLGGGSQWSEEDKQALGDRPPVELNQIFPVINTAHGLQINSRMDIAYRPRADGDEESATILSKLAKQICDNNRYQWLESDAYVDGLVQQRGYLDVRLDFSDNALGEVRIDTLDPFDVMPDPDAKSYNPDKWADVIITRWMSLDDIESLYGKKKRKEVMSMPAQQEDDFGEGIAGENRAKFSYDYDGGFSSRFGDYDDTDEGALRRVQVIDRQFWRFDMMTVAIYPTGDIRPAPTDPNDLAQVEMAGAVITKRPMRRVRWVVTAGRDVVLHDDWSPYQHFTVVPFFPYFRRGRTRGMVDNLLSPQEVGNKVVSQVLHILNTTANSGWVVEEDSLTNMQTDDLQQWGAKTGLTIEHKKGSAPPQKIQPNTVPTGLDRLGQQAQFSIKEISGVSDALQGQPGAEVSGVAIQTKQAMGQMQMAPVLDALAKTRHMVAERILCLIQEYMTAPQMYRIVETDGFGKEAIEQIPLNMPQPDGTVLNDLTLGEYDVVVSDQPHQATFRDSQFRQALEMRQAGVALPDHILIQYSNLAKKNEILESLRGQPDPIKEAEAAHMQAKARLTEAQAAKADADRAKVATETVKTALEASAAVLSAPGLEEATDEILGSVGFTDHNGAGAWSATPPVMETPASAIPMPPSSGAPMAPYPNDTGYEYVQ